jgi:pilus assembly protein CpaB
MKSRNILIAALVMAILTTILFRQYLQGLDKKYKGSQSKVSIVVAKQDIPKNQKVTKEMLELKEFSADSVHPEAVKKIEDLVGDYALIDIKPGEELFASRFTDQFKETELITRKIREGYRAVAIEVNPVESVANLIQPEDYVDVTFTEKNKDSVTLLENVRVLAVGKRITETEAVSKDAKGTEQKTNQADYNSVTVELKPEDVLKLVGSDEKGNIKLVLRSKVAK